MHSNITLCISVVETTEGQATLQRAAESVRHAYADTDPDLKEAIEQGGDPVVDIGVSFDGTWQKRGFTSLFGVGVCIDIMTGLVVDYEVLSKYCHACKLTEAKHLPADQLRRWREEHQPDCCMNHDSKAMEQEAARKMWWRSVEQFNLRYTKMLSDGDSSAYRAVCDSQPYGPDVVIEKLECINHAHKRMGTALRKLAKTEHLGGRGVGRLTEKKCDNLQNFYRGAVLGHLASVQQMRSAVWASFFHCISTDELPKHERCPEGADSSCFYQRALAAGEEPPSHRDHPTHTHISLDVAKMMVPVYKRMTDESLLVRMVHGGTQNANECLNSQIWLRCPKTVFMGKRRVAGAVARAVSTFNEGTSAMVSVMNSMWVDVSSTTLNQLKAIDARRIARSESAKSASKEARSESTKRKRQVMREQEVDEGQTYAAGMAE